MKKLIVLFTLAILLTGCDVIRDVWHQAKPTHVRHKPTKTLTVIPASYTPWPATTQPINTVAPTVPPTDQPTVDPDVTPATPMPTSTRRPMPTRFCSPENIFELPDSQGTPVKYCKVN